MKKLPGVAPKFCPHCGGEITAEYNTHIDDSFPSIWQITWWVHCENCRDDCYVSIDYISTETRNSQTPPSFVILEDGSDDKCTDPDCMYPH